MIHEVINNVLHENDTRAVGRAVPMMARFYKERQPDWPLDMDLATRTLEMLATAPFGYVAATPGGFIAGQVSDHPLASDWKVASEILWWASDGRGLELAAAFKAWAKEQGAKEIMWSCPPGARANAILGRWGRKTEIHYSELLPCA